MNTTRLWTFGSVMVIIALIAGTWFVGISPRLTEAATANSERAAAEAQNAVQAATLASLKKQFESIGELRSELSELRVAVPADAAVPELMRQLDALASASGVLINNVSLAPPAPFVPPVEAPEDAELSAALGSVSSDTFLSIRVEVSVSGAHGNVMQFLTGLQTGERAILVTDFMLGNGLPAAGTLIEVTFTGEAFVLLDQGAAAPVAESPAPAGQDGATPDTGVAPQ